MLVRARRLRRFLFAALFAAALPARAFVPTDELYELDDRGDAKISSTYQYGAAQWAIFREQYADHPDVWLRNIRYLFARDVVDDFSVERDDVRRRAVAHLKARAVAGYHDGEFVFDLTKEVKLMSNSGRDWILTTSAVDNGEIINQTIHVKLPTGAQNAHFSESGDFNHIIYYVNLTPPRRYGWLEAGVALLALGGAAGVVSIRYPNAKSQLPASS